MSFYPVAQIHTLTMVAWFQMLYPLIMVRIQIFLMYSSPHLHSRYADARGHSIGKTPLVFLNSSTCIATAKSIHKMHVTIFHVGKHKRHFSNTVQLTCRSQRSLKFYCVCTAHAARISYAVKFTAHLPAESFSCETTFKDERGESVSHRYSAWTRKKTTLFSGHYLRNRSTLDVGVFGYIGIV